MYHASRSPGLILGLAKLRARFPGISPALWAGADALFPVRVTTSFAARITGPDDPLARQVLPLPEELLPAPGDTPDPVGEQGRSPMPWVVHKHRDRVLVQVTRRCHLYCRYCFRRDQHDAREPTAAELDAALDYARAQGARELILSGGDPLTLTDARLFSLIDRARPGIPVIRVHTRAPITAPSRVTPALVAGLRARAPVWVLVHCNHAQELAPDVVEALGRLVDAGVPVLNQSVLLRGVNDSVDALEALSDALLRLRVFPYYLHHTDPVPGNAALRVSMEEGLALHRALARRVSGIGLPTYVIDPPDGSGKVPVSEWAAPR
jgi:lysine 2,3-aminomutase